MESQTVQSGGATSGLVRDHTANDPERRELKILKNKLSLKNKSYKVSKTNYKIKLMKIISLQIRSMSFKSKFNKLNMKKP